MKKLTKLKIIFSATCYHQLLLMRLLWTMEEQPDRMARQQQIAADFNAALVIQ